MVSYVKVEELCQKDSLTPEMKMIKLSEEVGEASAELLAMRGHPNKSRSAVGTPEALAEELIDCKIVIDSLLVGLGFTPSYLRDLADKKLAKWEAKIEANNE